MLPRNHPDRIADLNLGESVEPVLEALQPESTEGGPWGQPLKKREGAPMNLG